MRTDITIKEQYDFYNHFNSSECTLFAKFMQMMRGYRIKKYDRWEVFHALKDDRRKLVRIARGEDSDFQIYKINPKEYWKNYIIN